MQLKLTPSQAYRRKQRLWSLYCGWSERIRRAFFPDTGGVSLYMHNWYKCAEKTNPEGAQLAEWVDDSTYARYRRLESIMVARDSMREHLHHVDQDSCEWVKVGKHYVERPTKFRPLWCPHCQAMS